MKKTFKLATMCFLMASGASPRAEGLWSSSESRAAHTFQSETHGEGKDVVKTTTETSIQDGVKTVTITEERLRNGQTFVTKKITQEPVKTENFEAGMVAPHPGFKKCCHRWWKKHKKSHDQENHTRETPEYVKKEGEAIQDQASRNEEKKDSKLLKKLNLMVQLLNELHAQGALGNPSSFPVIKIEGFDGRKNPEATTKDLGQNIQKNIQHMNQNIQQDVQNLQQGIQNQVVQNLQQGIQNQVHQMASLGSLWNFSPTWPM